MRWWLACEPDGEEPVHRAPGVLVGRARHAGERRAGRHLPPEEAVEVVGVFPGEHAVHHVEVLEAVPIEVERVRRPRPPPHLRARAQAHVLERPVALVAEERVAPRVTLVDLPHLRGGVGLEAGQRGHPQPRRRPHVPGVDVQAAVVVVVEEGRAHPRPVVLDSRLLRHVPEADLAVLPAQVAEEVLAAEVVGHEQVGPAVVVVVAPGGGEAEAVVVHVEARFRGHVHEAPARRRCGRGRRAGRCSRRGRGSGSPPCPRPRP